MRLKDLTKAQQRLVKLLYNNNYYIVCNEGHNFKCWIEDENRNKIDYIVRTDTADILFRDGWIESEFALDYGGIFYHKLTERAVRKIERGF